MTKPESNDGGTQPSGTPDYIVQVRAGAAHACLLMRGTNRRTACWGSNAHGELGLGDTVARNEPTWVPAFAGVTKIATGGAGRASGHTCGLRDGQVWCTGANAYGQVGDKSRETRTQPVRVGTFDDAVELDLGDSHSCILRFNGEVWCWGRGDSGQLGNGSLSDQLEPVPVTGINDAFDLSVGFYHACVRRTLGKVSCWGANAYGELGRGDRLSALTPVDVPAFHGASAVFSGGFATCATFDDQARCCGNNEYGQLGNGMAGAGLVSEVPVPVVDLPGVIELVLGGSHTCARSNAEELWCWGANAMGQLGDGTTLAQTKPKKVRTPVAVTLLAAGAGFTVFEDAKLGLSAFGANADGQLGDGTQANRAQVNAVHLPPKSP